jgi:hypothetical protein
MWTKDIDCSWNMQRCGENVARIGYYDSAQVQTSSTTDVSCNLSQNNGPALKDVCDTAGEEDSLYRALKLDQVRACRYFALHQC